MSDTKEAFETWLRFYEDGFDDVEYEANTFVDEDGYWIEWYHVDVGVVTRVESFTNLAEVHLWYKNAGYENVSSESDNAFYATCEYCNSYDNVTWEDTFMNIINGAWACALCAEELGL